MLARLRCKMVLSKDGVLSRGSFDHPQHVGFVIPSQKSPSWSTCHHSSVQAERTEKAVQLLLPLVREGMLPEAPGSWDELSHSQTGPCAQAALALRLIPPTLTQKQNQGSKSKQRESIDFY